MKTQLRKVGNSVGQIIPVNVLRELDLQVGDELELSVSNGQLVATPIRAKAQYTLDELLAKCDENAPNPLTTSEPSTADLTAWEQLQPVGLENDF